MSSGFCLTTSDKAGSAGSQTGQGPCVGGAVPVGNGAGAAVEVGCWVGAWEVAVGVPVPEKVGVSVAVAWGVPLEAALVAVSVLGVACALGAVFVVAGDVDRRLREELVWVTWAWCASVAAAVAAATVWASGRKL